MKKLNSYFFRKVLSFYTTIILFISLLTLPACRKENATSSPSSKIVYFCGDNDYFYISGQFVYNGNPGFYLRDSYKKGTTFDNNYRKVEYHVANGKYSNSLQNNFPYPAYSIRNNYFQQIQSGVNSFVILSRVTRYDSSYQKVLFGYRELYLTDKDNSSPRKFELPDSTETLALFSDFYPVKTMADGRLLICFYKDTKLSLTCFNGSLKADWTSSVNYGTGSGYSFRDLLITQNYIYLLIINSVDYKVIQYDYKGQMISTFDVSSSTSKLSVNDLIESKDGFFICEAKYVAEISDYDFHISNMSAANKLVSAHVLNIKDYLQDCNNENWNVNEANKSLFVKTSRGYAFTFTYPNNNNQIVLSMVLLDENMKISSVKVIAKHDRATLDYSEIFLFNNKDKLVILQKFNKAVFTYFLDEEGSLLKK